MVFPNFHLLPAINPRLVVSASLKRIIFIRVICTVPTVVQFILIFWILNVLLFLHSLDRALAYSCYLGSVSHRLPTSQVLDDTFIFCLKLFFTFYTHTLWLAQSATIPYILVPT